jgi:hypothetical protein
MNKLAHKQNLKNNVFRCARRADEEKKKRRKKEA